MNLAIDLFVVAACIAFAVLVFSIAVQSLSDLYERFTKNQISGSHFMWGFFGRVMANAVASTVAVLMAVGTWFV